MKTTTNHRQKKGSHVGSPFYTLPHLSSSPSQGEDRGEGEGLEVDLKGQVDGVPVAALACPRTQIPGASGVLLQSGGSSLVIAVLSTFSGFLGKLLTGQIPFLITLAVVTGAAFGALGGEQSHSRASPRVLRYVYATVVGVVAVRIWITILG